MLDAGAFIGVERRSAFATKLLGRLVRANIPLVTSGAVVAQIWRGGTGRQAPVAMLLSQVEVMALGGAAARLVGMMLGACGGKDPADGHVVLLARERGWPVLTADEADLRAIDPSIELVRV
ncbi:MAG: twitching motility protein PilT [Myxococcaceae bacterium]|nr:twitching motility protein PilT [Myxococcaceae bacterium]MEA2749862.1 hypothetical protein [Myxococcales bacterium]